MSCTMTIERADGKRAERRVVVAQAKQFAQGVTSASLVQALMHAGLERTEAQRAVRLALESGEIVLNDDAQLVARP